MQPTDETSVSSKGEKSEHLKSKKHKNKPTKAHEAHDKQGTHKHKTTHSHDHKTHSKHGNHAKGKELKTNTNSHHKHKPKPTLSEEMVEDKKMADRYKQLLRHPYLMRMLQQMDSETSGSGSGSGEGSGELPMLTEYMKMQRASKHKKMRPGLSAKRGHGKSKPVDVTLKESEVTKIHPVPLSKLDIDLIDALSSGAPSTFNLF